MIFGEFFVKQDLVTESEAIKFLDGKIETKKKFETA